MRRSYARLKARQCAHSTGSRPTATSIPTVSSSSQALRARLDNQSWKDSGDSQRFSDGRFAASPIAPCEVQGYVYDAKLRCAELAREVWRDRALAERLEREAAALAKRFDEAFWIDERGGYYALGLDRDKQQIDSICSNMDITLVGDRAAAPGRRHRRSADGRGVVVRLGHSHHVIARSRLQPTQLPQRQRLAARQLALRLGPGPLRALDRVQRILYRMLGVAKHFGYQLPEVFSGMPAPRRRFRSPIRLRRGHRPGPPERPSCCFKSCSE